MQTLKPNERLVQTGTVGWRGPDGAIIRSDPFYSIIEIEPGEAAKTLSQGEKKACEDSLRDMVAQFGRYVRESKKIGDLT